MSLSVIISVFTKSVIQAINWIEDFGLEIHPVSLCTLNCKKHYFWLGKWPIWKIIIYNNDTKISFIQNHIEVRMIGGWMCYFRPQCQSITVYIFGEFSSLRRPSLSPIWDAENVLHSLSNPHLQLKHGNSFSLWLCQAYKAATHLKLVRRRSRN